MLPEPIQSAEARREAGLERPQPTGERLRHAAGLFGSYWLSKDWKFAWAALLLLLGFQFAAVYINIGINRWQQHFFDAIEQRAAAQMTSLILAYAGLMLAQIGSELFNTYVGKTLAIRWRTVLTQRYVDRWLARNRYIEIERLRLIDNPDQRIADDIGLVTGTTVQHNGLVGLVVETIGVVFGAYSFTRILMESVEPLHLTLFGRALELPGLMVWYAYAYALLGSVAITWIGKPFVRAMMRLQHREADFRTGLVQVRRNAPQIGFTGALSTERAGLLGAFDLVRLSFHRMLMGLLCLNVGQGVHQRLGGLLPLFLLLPRFFAGAISFGQLMAARQAFETLVLQLSFLVNGYVRWGQQIAYVNRLKGLDDAIDDARPRGIAVSDAAAGATALLATHGLHIHRPDGQPLLAVDDWAVQPGERWLIEGPSGAGKSTLLRALVGLWPDGAGRVELGKAARIMVVPQRLYLPTGTLKGAVCFPDADAAHDDAAILALLERAGLSAHRDQLHAVRFWQDELSPGEQQRVALARILLHRPELLLLDEATSALDTGNAHRFHQELLADLPAITLISVVHDTRLAPYHSHRLTIADGRATPALIGAAA